MSNMQSCFVYTGLFRVGYRGGRRLSSCPLSVYFLPLSICVRSVFSAYILLVNSHVEPPAADRIDSFSDSD